MMLLLNANDMIISSLDPVEGTKPLAVIKEILEIDEKGTLDWYIGTAVENLGHSIELRRLCQSRP